MLLGSNFILLDNGIESLCKLVTSGTNDAAKEVVLEKIGYICSNLEVTVLESKSNVILTAIAYGMRGEETNLNIKRAAVKAMPSSLDFTGNNFNSELERNHIMQLACDAAQISGSLCKLVTSGTNDAAKEVVLEKIGYICSNLEVTVLESKSNVILTAIAYGMRGEETNLNIKRAAVKAMPSSLDFTGNNFNSELERNHIMQLACDAAQISGRRRLPSLGSTMISSIGLNCGLLLNEHKDVIAHKLETGCADLFKAYKIYFLDECKSVQDYDIRDDRAETGDMVPITVFAY
uniref:CCT-eta n=1 Tax=Rhabditophanes sp. KR3021 TaxID=114890 RepID=A0AC35TX53_9BILA